MNTFTELKTLLRPSGGGLYLVSTGRADQLALQRRLYRAATNEEVTERFHETLARVLDPKSPCRTVLVGVPSDIGAGFVRGANLGPQGIRTKLLEAVPDFGEAALRHGVVDLGDVFVVPQLLHDDMLTEEQKEATRRAIYPSLSVEEAKDLPVSPLSIAERVFNLLFSHRPDIAPIVLGGDHSTAWPCAAALARYRKDRFAIVQIDAHTDLLPHRLGIKYCFATWSYHANELFGRDGRLVQLGIRASGRSKEHWEETLGVKQLWASECRENPKKALDEMIAHLRHCGVESVYFSNDIDGTDSSFADATGTPEPNGLSPDFVVEVIHRLKESFCILGGDIMEVAPPLARSEGGVERTLDTAVRYLRETISAVTGAEI